MGAKILILLIGIALTVSKIKNFIVIHTGWIVLCFFIWIFLSYIAIHNRNKSNNIPRPVYVVRQG